MLNDFVLKLKWRLYFTTVQKPKCIQNVKPDIILAFNTCCKDFFSKCTSSFFLHDIVSLFQGQVGWKLHIISGWNMSLKAGLAYNNKTTDNIFGICDFGFHRQTQETAQQALVFKAAWNVMYLRGMDCFLGGSSLYRLKHLSLVCNNEKSDVGLPLHVRWHWVKCSWCN